MLHKMTIKKDANVPHRPYLANCSCGPSGNFVEMEAARQFLQSHAGTLAAGINTVEFTDETDVKPDDAAGDAEKTGEAPATPEAEPESGPGPSEEPAAGEDEEVKKNGESGSESSHSTSRSESTNWR